MFSPFIKTKDNMDSMTKEIVRVFEATKGQKENALPSVVSSTFTVKGVDYEITGDEYIQVQKRVGELSKQKIDEYIKSAEYKKHGNGTDVTDADRAKKFAKIYEKAREDAKDEFKDNNDIELYRK
jgi:hypothetical protein